MTADDGIYNTITRSTWTQESVGGLTATKMVVDGTASQTHYGRDDTAAFTPAEGKAIAFQADVYIPSGNTLVDGISFSIGQSGYTLAGKYATISTTADGDVQISADTWTTVTTPALVYADQGTFDFALHLMDGTVATFSGNSSDYAAVKNQKIFNVGAVAEYDGSGVGASRWDDKSGNELHGTVTGATVENAPADADSGLTYEEGTWTPTNSNAITVNSANYTKIGRQVVCQFDITVDAGAATTGDMGGLPFTASPSASYGGSVVYTNHSSTETYNVLVDGGTAWTVRLGSSRTQIDATKIFRGVMTYFV